MKDTATKKKRRLFPIRVKTTIMIVVFGLILAEIAMIYFTISSSRENRAQFKAAATDLSETVALSIDVEKFKNVKGQIASIYDSLETKLVRDDWEDTPEFEAYLEECAQVKLSQDYIDLQNYLKAINDVNDDTEGVYVCYVDYERGLGIYLVYDVENEWYPTGMIDYIYEEDYPMLENPMLGFVASIFVGVGPSNSENDLVIKDKCAFVCGATTATLSKYLYDRHDTSFTGTATVPATVDRFDGATCTVNAIGASAFSAAYCDGTNYKNYSNHKDLTAISVPHTITTIGEYAFMRAYGVTKLSSYNASTGVTNGDYVMPSSLTSIGKQAFAFCNIKQFLNIPNGCRFYENTSNTNYETSVFSNNFSLRKITFGNNSTSSTYYTTTTYIHSSDTYTSALYSTNSVSKNKNSLLLVLNRDNADRTATSGDVTIAPTTIGEDTFDFVEFNGRYNNRSGYLYGAFKMCYWIDSLVVGAANQSTYDQPLISGVYDVSGNKDSLLYLNQAYSFTGNACKLKAISFGDAAEITTPSYSFEGCEQLTKIKLPRKVGGSIPAGLFAYISNEHIVFEVPSNADGTAFKECDEGELDLTYTGYTEIKAEAFKETNITKVIAPITDTFTIGTDAFGNCTQLSEFDFSNVTETVNINGSFKGATIHDDLFTFGDGVNDADIRFGDEAFKGCTFADTKTFTFPAKTALIGNSCFESSNIENVTAEAVLTNLESVVVDNGSGKNNAGNDTGFKQIGNYAFFNCISLKNFDFTKFTQVERIGHYAFSMAKLEGTQVKPENPITNNAIICPNGVVDLPASITNIGVGAFNGSKITSITINSSALKFERGKSYTTDTRANINCGCHTFRKCSALTKVYFSDPNCTWNTKYLLKSEDGQDNFFSDCPLLTKVSLPKDYDLQYYKYTGTGSNPPNGTRPDSMVWGSSDNLKFYVHHTVNDLDPDGIAINEFWHRMSSGSSAPIVFFVATTADVISGTSGSYAEIRLGTEYWALVNGEMIYIGTVTSINQTTGVVTFQVSGYTADSTGVMYNGNYL